MYGQRRDPIPPAARLADDADWLEPPSDFARIGKAGRRFSWLSPRTLWRSRNNVLASLTGDPTESARRAWVEAQRKSLRAAGAPPELSEDFTLVRDDLRDFSFMVMGDSGEGDVSQYAVVPAFLNVSQDTEFTVIASDVVYPDGDVNEYIGKFFVPYAGYPRPIYAIPGNHDWLDGLAGFMRHFCAADPPGKVFRPPPRAKYAGGALALHSLLWRRPAELAENTLREAEALRGKAAASGPRQPNMYFAIDTPQLRIIGIDTGILGRLDHEQGEWLRRVAAGPKPKLLVSGKPVYSGPDFSPRRILSPEGTEGAAAGMLWSVVSDPANNFVAMISGDVHHYERHDVRLDDGRVLPCVITGGGGAFMTSTHQIPRVERPEVGEADWVVFPTRGDSLRAYSISLQRRFGVDRPHGIPADEAAAIVAQRHGLDLGDELARGGAVAEPGSVRVSSRSKRLASIIFPRREWFESSKISEALDWDDAPFFKHCVRFDLRGDELVLTTFGINGLARDEREPPVIDRVSIKLGS